VECPADKNELGRASWKFLHTMSVYLPENDLTVDQQSDVKGLVKTFSRLYPCQYCADDMKTDLKEHPPVTSTGKGFALWLCGLHNRVNEKLDKPIFDCGLVYERWRDGWKDGSCDPPS
jgi:FAD-linked sulfhydryl oxidase